MLGTMRPVYTNRRRSTYNKIPCRLLLTLQKEAAFFIYSICGGGGGDWGRAAYVWFIRGGGGLCLSEIGLFRQTEYQT